MYPTVGNPFPKRAELTNVNMAAATGADALVP
jgi:pyruvate kinase